MINVDSSQWQEMEAFLRQELLDKPLDIKTEGRTAEEIALEVRALQIANQKINKLLVSIKGLGKPSNPESTRFI